MQSSQSANFSAHLVDFTILELNGIDSVKFLQGQITINAEQINDEKLLTGAICNPQGRCVSLFFATRLNGSILLVMPKSIADGTIEHLKKYAVFFKVDIKRLDDELIIVGEYSCSENNDSPSESYRKLTPELSIKLCSSQDNIEFTSTQNDWLYHLAENKMPWLTSVTQLAFLPHNLNLPELNAVDFKKGCYTGQEIIARMHYKGKLKSHLQKLTADKITGDIQEKSPLLADGEVAGEVVCSATSSLGQTCVLALIKDKYLSTKKFQLSEEILLYLN